MTDAKFASWRSCLKNPKPKKGFLMTTVNSETGSSADQMTQPDPRRWRALAVPGLIQFMLILDVTVVNVALSRIQHDVGSPVPAWPGSSTAMS